MEPSVTTDSCKLPPSPQSIQNESHNDMLPSILEIDNIIRDEWEKSREKREPGVRNDEQSSPLEHTESTTTESKSCTVSNDRRLCPKDDFESGSSANGVFNTLRNATSCEKEWTSYMSADSKSLAHQTELKRKAVEELRRQPAKNKIPASPTRPSGQVSIVQKRASEKHTIHGCYLFVGRKMNAIIVGATLGNISWTQSTTIVEYYTLRPINHLEAPEYCEPWEHCYKIDRIPLAGSMTAPNGDGGSVLSQPYKLAIISCILQERTRLDHGKRSGEWTLNSVVNFSQNMDDKPDFFGVMISFTPGLAALEEGEIVATTGGSSNSAPRAAINQPQRSNTSAANFIDCTCGRSFPDPLSLTQHRLMTLSHNREPTPPPAGSDAAGSTGKTGHGGSVGHRGRDAPRDIAYGVLEERGMLRPSFDNRRRYESVERFDRWSHASSYYPNSASSNYGSYQRGW